MCYVHMYDMYIYIYMYIPCIPEVDFPNNHVGSPKCSGLENDRLHWTYPSCDLSEWLNRRSAAQYASPKSR